MIPENLNEPAFDAFFFRCSGVRLIDQPQQGGPICSVQIAEANCAKAQDSARYAEPPFLRIPSPHPRLSQYLHLSLRPRPKFSLRLNRSLLRCQHPSLHRSQRLHPSLHLSRRLNRSLLRCQHPSLHRSQRLHPSLHRSRPRYTSISHSLCPRPIRRRLFSRRPYLKNLRR